MSRITWVYPSDGSDPYVKGTKDDIQSQGRGFATILPDLPDFVSPVDGKRYSGRAGMREHNLRNNVVPVSDLAGLPYLTKDTDMTPPDVRRRMDAERKQMIINQVNKHYR